MSMEENQLPEALHTPGESVVEFEQTSLNLPGSPVSSPGHLDNATLVASGDGSDRELIASLKRIIVETTRQRDILHHKFTYALAMLKEQDQLMADLSAICTKAQQQHSSIWRIPAVGTKDQQWIGGWLTGTSKALKDAEKAWAKGKSQDALFKVSKLLHRNTLKAEEAVNARLLKVAILHGSNQIEQSLEECDSTLRMAKEYNLPQLAGKASWLRGLYLLQGFEGREAEASWAFVNATGTPGHAEQIEAYLGVSERKRLEASGDSAQPYLPLDFGQGPSTFDI